MEQARRVAPDAAGEGGGGSAGRGHVGAATTSIDPERMILIKTLGVRHIKFNTCPEQVGLAWAISFTQDFICWLPRR